MDPEVTVVSIAGGDNDLLVVDKLTQSPLNDFQTSVSGSQLYSFCL